MTDPATEPVDGPDEPDEPAADPDDVLVAAPAISAEIEVDPTPQELDVDESDAVLDTALDDIDAFLAEEPDYLGDLQRVTAEFANFRKQTDKRNQELLARASMRLVEALLPVLDAFDAAALRETQSTLVVQVNGKVRARLTVPVGASDEQLKTAVLADTQVKKFVDGHVIKKFIIVPKRLVNIVL